MPLHEDTQTRYDLVPDGEDARFLPDEKGRKKIEIMTDREIIEEQLAISRATQDLVEKFFNDFASGKMGGMMGMMGKFLK